MHIEAVAKIGGSIIKDRHRLVWLCRYIIRLVRQNYKIIIIPGGGAIVDEIRKIYREFKISENIAHWMAIMGMDINGFLISSANKRLIPVDNINESRKVLRSNCVPILLPYKILKKYDELPRSWDVTSDSISLYIASLLNAQFNILLKDVDGIIEEAERHAVLERINAQRLKGWKTKTCIDKYLPTLLLKYKINTYVISGHHPSRIKRILDGKNVRGTLITP